MANDTMLALVLTGFLLYFSMDFHKHYSNGFHEAALHPAARFIAGLAVVYLSQSYPLLASILLMIVFFWMADVNLLSSFQL